MDKIKTLLGENKEFDDQSLEERLAHYNVPGCALTIIEDYEVTRPVTFGTRASNGKDKVDGSTLFQAASISKMVFAALVLRLVEMKHLDLDTDVHTYLQGYTLKDRLGRKTSCTLRQLLSHTGGTNVHGFRGYTDHSHYLDETAILEGRSSVNSRPLYKVRKDAGRFKYSGGGTTLAQKSICDALGEPLDVLMERFILKPLKMNRSTMMQPLPASVDNVAHGHTQNRKKIKNNYRYHPEKAAAGLWTTSYELALFGKALMESYEGRHEFMGRPSLQTMAEPVTDKNILKNRPDLRAGVGCFVNDTAGRLVICHSGSNAGYVCDAAFSLTSGQGYVIMLNADEGAPLLKEFGDAFTRIFFGDDTL